MQMDSQKPFLLRDDGDGQYLRMDRRREMGGFKICGMHVDLHQGEQRFVLRTLHSVRGAVEHAAVLSAHAVESNNGKTMR